MTAMSLIWFFVGILAGGLHIGMLKQASQPTTQSLPWHWVRLPLVGAIFVASALCGGILQTAFGWVIAYFATLAVVAIRPLR